MFRQCQLSRESCFLLSCLSYHLQSESIVFFLYSRAARVISQISQSRQRTLTLTLDNWLGYFRALLVFFRGFLVVFFFSFRSRKSVTPLLGNLRNFGVFILAKCRGSSNKLNTYFLRSLDSSLFICRWIFNRRKKEGCKVWKGKK